MSAKSTSVARNLGHRLWCLWRILVIVPLLVLGAAWFAGSVGGLNSAYLMPQAILRTVAIASGLTALAIWLLPAAPLEILAGGIIGALFVATEPWHGLAFQPAHKGGDFTPYWVRVAMFGLIGYLSFTILIWITALIAGALPPARGRLRYGLTVRDADAEELRRLLAIHPETTCGRISFGPRDWDGFVTAELHRRSHDPVTFAMTDTVFKYRTRHLRRDGDTEVHEVRIEGEDPREVRARYRQVGRNVRIDIEERPGPPDRLARLAIRLGSAGSDLLRARVDAALDRPSPAILLISQYSLLCLIARLTRLPRPRPKPDAEPT